MRVPIGSPSGEISTAALRSKRTLEPSARRTLVRVRTMTALWTSPFFTRPRGIASLTETTMTSPIEAYLRFEPPSTFTHITLRAPELSATSSRLFIWIMASILSGAGRRRRVEHDFPALAFGHRPAFADLHAVAGLHLVALVVREIFLRTNDEFLVGGMQSSALDLDRHGLLVLIFLHYPLQHS